MKIEIPSFIKPSGHYMLEHFKQLKDDECLLVIPNDPKDGKGYTTKTIKIGDVK